MTQPELFQALKTIGLPIAYGSFYTTVAPPFITYQFSYSNDFMADNINYQEISNFQVELYTKIKDLASEKKLQDKLKELGMTYSKTEAWLDEEKIFQIIYEIQLIGE